MTIIEGAKKFDGRGKLMEPWDNEYADNSSDKYKDLKSRLETHLGGILEKKYGQNLLDLEVENFHEGSIIFDFTVFLTSTTDVNADSLKEAIEKDEGDSNFTISIESVKQVAGPAPTTTCPTEQPEPTCSVMAWIVVVIILVIIILVLLALLLWLIVSNDWSYKRFLSSEQSNNRSCK